MNDKKKSLGKGKKNKKNAVYWSRAPKAPLSKNSELKPLEPTGTNHPQNEPDSTPNDNPPGLASK